MFPVDINVMSRMMYQALLSEAEQKRQVRRNASRQTSLWTSLQLWTGKALIGLGNRLVAKYPIEQIQRPIERNAHMA